MADSHSFTGTGETAFLSALKAGILYVLFASLWIISSDRIILLLFSHNNPETLTELQTAKGWLFVLATGGIFFLLTYRTLSSLHHSRNQLMEREKSYYMLFESNPHPMFICNQHTLQIVEANEAALGKYGYTHKELLGMTVRDISLERENTSLENYFQTHEPYHPIIIPQKKKDGNAFSVELTAGTTTFNNQNSWIVLVQDITAREQAEKSLKIRARQQEAIATLGVRALSTSDLDSVMNETVALTARTLDVGFSTIQELFPDEHHLVLRAGKGWKEGTIGQIARTGKYSQAGYTLLAEASVIVEDLAEETRFEPSSLLVEHGIVSGITVIIRGTSTPFGVIGAHTSHRRIFTRDDVYFIQAVANILAEAIGRVRSEQAIRALNEDLEGRVAERTVQLQTINKELEAFTYSVSHDLRAPLRSINGFSKVLLEDCKPQLNEAHVDYLQRICSASTRMGHLIDDLLNLSRITRSEMMRVDVNISVLAGTIMDEMMRQFPHRSVSCTISEKLIAHADPNLLRIVLQNLLDNAWKFTGPVSDPCIEVSSIQKKDQTVFFVRDNGVGFDMTYAGKLFGAFQRLHSVKEFEGTGIGLATVQRIIHRHGGKVWAESTVNKGATFYFTLS